MDITGVAVMELPVAELLASMLAEVADVDDITESLLIMLGKLAMRRDLIRQSLCDTLFCSILLPNCSPSAPELISIPILDPGVKMLYWF
jgi:hypothetical protein